MHISARLMIGSGPDELVLPNRTLPVLRDGSQHLLAGGSEGDGDAGGGHGPFNPKFSWFHSQIFRCVPGNICSHLMG